MIQGIDQKGITLDIEDTFSLKNIPSTSSTRHHSIADDLLYTVMQVLGTGAGLYYTGDAEGWMYFYKGAICSAKCNTSLTGGAGGMDKYLTVQATYIAPEATVVTKIELYGSKNGRTVGTLFSTKEVNQALVNAEVLTINWTLRADV